MVKEIHREGDHPESTDLDADDVRRIIAENAEADHAYTGDTTHSAFDFYRSAELQLGGQVSGLETGAAHGLTHHEIEEQRKRFDEKTYATKLAIQLADTGSLIEALELRNLEIDRLLSLLYGRKEELEQEDHDLQDELHEIQGLLGGIDAGLAHVTAAIAETQQAVQKAEFDAEKAYERLYKMGLPKDVIHVTRFEKEDSCSRGDVQVAVYRNNDGKYFYKDPTTGTDVEITNPHQLRELEEQLRQGKKTADQITDPAEKQKLDSYNDAAARFLYLNQEAERRLEMLRRQQQEMQDLQDSKKTLEDRTREIEERRATILAELKEIGRQTRGLHNEKRENLERIKHLREELLTLQVEQTRIAEQLTVHDDRYQEIVSASQEATKQYNQYIQAQIDYDSAYEALWKGEGFYQNARETLERFDVMMITRDEKNIHIQYAVHKDDRGYFYYNMDGERKTISPKEIERLTGTKTVEDLAGNMTVEEADVFLRSSARDMAKAVEAAENASVFLPENANRQLVLSTSLMDILYSRSMIGPPTDEQAQYDEAEARINAKLNGQSITKGDLDEALRYASPETKARIEEMLQTKNIQVVEGTATKPIQVADSSINQNADQRLRQEMDIYERAKSSMGYTDPYLGGQIMLASATSGVLPAPTVFTGEPGPQHHVSDPDYPNIPHIRNEQMILAMDVTFDGQKVQNPNSMTDTNTFSDAVGQPYSASQQTPDADNILQRTRGTTYTA